MKLTSFWELKKAYEDILGIPNKDIKNINGEIENPKKFSKKMKILLENDNNFYDNLIKQSNLEGKLLIISNWIYTILAYKLFLLNPYYLKEILIKNSEKNNLHNPQNGKWFSQQKKINEDTFLNYLLANGFLNEYQQNLISNLKIARNNYSLAHIFPLSFEENDINIFINLIEELKNKEIKFEPFDKTLQNFIQDLNNKNQENFEDLKTIILNSIKNQENNKYIINLYLENFTKGNQEEISKNLMFEIIKKIDSPRDFIESILSFDNSWNHHNKILFLNENILFHKDINKIKGFFEIIKDMIYLWFKWEGIYPEYSRVASIIECENLWKFIFDLLKNEKEKAENFIFYCYDWFLFSDQNKSYSFSIRKFEEKIVKFNLDIQSFFDSKKLCLDNKEYAIKKIKPERYSYINSIIEKDLENNE